MNKRSQSRSAARLAAVQALYQHEMEATPVAKLIHEFHQHRIGATIEDAEYAGADTEFFDDIVKGTLARSEEIDAAIITRLASGWSMERLDRTMKAILRPSGDQRASLTSTSAGTFTAHDCFVASETMVNPRVPSVE